MTTPPKVNPLDRIFFKHPSGGRFKEGRTYDESDLVPFETALNSGTVSRYIQPPESKDNPTRKRVRKLEPSVFYFPAELDSEYQTPVSKNKEPELYRNIVKACQEIGKGSIPITAQIRGILEEGKGDIFLHPDFVKLFPEQKSSITPSNNILVSYFEEKGVKARIEWYHSDPNHKHLVRHRKVRVIKFDIYAHFAVADFYKVWCDYRFSDYLLSKSHGKGRVIQQQKYLKIEYKYTTKKKVTKNGVKTEEVRESRYRFIRIPAILYLNEVPFALEVGCVDTYAMLGEGGRSLKDAREASGIDIEGIKEYYNGDEKGHMLQQYAASEDYRSVMSPSDNPYKRIFDHNDPHFKAALEKRIASGIKRPFVEYALGDVGSLHKMIVGVGRQVKNVYDTLGISNRYRFPSPTVGSTVAHILLSKIKQEFHEAPLNLERSCDYAKHLPLHKNKPQLLSTSISLLTDASFNKASAVNLSKESTKAALLAKVVGGRVISKSATLISINGVIVDIDLCGAYPWAMKSQPLPLGTPVIWPDSGTRVTEDYSLTLQRFFNEKGHELVDGCWKLLFSVLDDNGNPLPNPVQQDFFPTWTPSASFVSKANGDNSGDWVTKSDKVKYYRYEILNTPLTSDSKDILDKFICEENRNHIMRYGRVIAYMYYPKSKMVDSAEEFIEKYVDYQVEVEKNKSRRPYRRKEIGDFEHWFKYDVGTLISDELLDHRDFWKKYTNAYKLMKTEGVFDLESFDKLGVDVQKSIIELAGGERRIESFIESALGRSKHPLDTVFKTIANTIYGDLTSKFFKISLPICGEGITSRVRCIIYMLESCCGGTNVITDGVFFNPNRIHKPYVEVEYNKRTGEEILKTYPLSDKNTFAALDMRTPDQLRKYKLAVGVLGGYDRIEWADDESKDLLFIKDGVVKRMDIKVAMPYICDLVCDHIRASFDPTIKIIASKHKFKFEAKGIVKAFANHGTANYYCEGGYHGSYPTIENDDGTKTVRPWSVTFRSYKPDFRDNNLRHFFLELIKRPNNVNRLLYASIEYKTTVLTVEKYAAAREVENSKLKQSILQPGDTEIVAQLFREFTPSAFRFWNREQEKTCENFNLSMRDVGNPYDETKTKYYGQSYEGMPQFIIKTEFELNPEEYEGVEVEYLRYRDMIEYVDSLVEKGESLKMDKEGFLEHPMLHYFRKAKGDLLVDWMKNNVNPNNIVLDDIPVDIELSPIMTREEFMAMWEEENSGYDVY